MILPLKTLNNFLRIEHKDLFFAVWCNSSSWLYICKKKLPPSSVFLLNTFFDKKCRIFKQKTSHFGERCFLVTSISTAGVFSQIFTTHPTAQGLKNTLLYGSVGSYRKSMKYGLPQKSQSHYIFPSIFIFNVRSYFPMAMAYTETW